MVGSTEVGEIGPNCCVREATIWSCDSDERAGSGGEGCAEGGWRRCPMGNVPERRTPESAPQKEIGDWVPEQEEDRY